LRFNHIPAGFLERLTEHAALLLEHFRIPVVAVSRSAKRPRVASVPCPEMLHPVERRSPH
jgi:hypothetical protein